MYCKRHLYAPRLQSANVKCIATCLRLDVLHNSNNKHAITNTSDHNNEKRSFLQSTLMADARSLLIPYDRYVVLVELDAAADNNGYM